MKVMNAAEMKNTNGGARYMTKCGLYYYDKYFWFFKTFDGKKARNAHQSLCAACKCGQRLYWY